MGENNEKADKAGRQDRLKAALRANLRRRKAQARDRDAQGSAAAGTEDDHPSDG